MKVELNWREILCAMLLSAHTKKKTAFFCYFTLLSQMNFKFRGLKAGEGRGDLHSALFYVTVLTKRGRHLY